MRRQISSLGVSSSHIRAPPLDMLTKYVKYIDGLPLNYVSPLVNQTIVIS